MNLGGLRRFIEGIAYLPDETDLIVEQKDGGQDEALCAEVCTYEYGGLHYSKDSVKENEDNTAFDPECWEKLEKPTVKIAMC
ncbi:hypothetical protein KAU09_02535 [Candidatus Parcubacteria bacterium]|nr:hypothetical protein [Candidatus Parcubacteria bacterium]